MPTIPTGAIINGRSAEEFFSFLEIVLPKKMKISLRATPDAMNVFDRLCRAEKIQDLLLVKSYRNGLMHIVKAR